MNSMHTVKAHAFTLHPKPIPVPGTQAATGVAGLARTLMQEGMETPRQLFSRINGTLVRPGAKRISRRVERTATEVLYFLFRCHIADKSPSVTEVYLSTGLARGTTIRCLAALGELGVLETSTDARDRRRTLIRFARSYQRLVAEFSDGHCRRLDEQLAASGYVRTASRVS